jgi:hypothetical protein
MPYHPRITDHTNGTYNAAPYWAGRSPVLEWAASSGAPSPDSEGFFHDAYWHPAYFPNSYWL